MANPFYQTLYQNEILYKVVDKTTELKEPVPMQESLSEKVIKVLDDEKPVIKATPAAEIAVTTSSSEQKNRILVVADTLSPSDSVYLDKILNALKIDRQNVDLEIVDKRTDLNFRPLLRSGRYKYFISFGVPFLKVNVDLMMNRYDPKTFGGIYFVFSDALPVVEADERNRRALWAVLKPLFTSN